MNGIPFRIVKITIDNFSIDNDAKVCNDAPLDIESNFSFGVDTEGHVVKCDSEYEFIFDSKTILSLRIGSFFEIELEAFNDFYNSKREFVISKDFLRYMATICVGTARGIIIAKSENTPIANVVLPPLNLMEAIKDDFIIPSV